MSPSLSSTIQRYGQCSQPTTSAFSFDKYSILIVLILLNPMSYLSLYKSPSQWNHLRYFSTTTSYSKPNMTTLSDTQLSATYGTQEEFAIKKGSWTEEEDSLLINYVNLHGEGHWNSLARSAGNYACIHL